MAGNFGNFTPLWRVSNTSLRNKVTELQEKLETMSKTQKQKENVIQGEEICCNPRLLLESKCCSNGYNKTIHWTALIIEADI